MEPLSEKNIRAQLLDFLANLQNTATVRERQTLVDYTGFQRLTSQISWEGDTFTFFGGLVNLLAHAPIAAQCACARGC